MAKIESEGISTTFKDQLYSGFQSLYVAKFKQRYNEYITYLKDHIKIALRSFVSSLTPTSTTTDNDAVSTPIEKATTYVFTKPFKSGEYGEGVKALQNLLITLKLYS